MTYLLRTLTEITLTMSAVILALLLLGPLLSRRYAPRWRYWAWLAVAVRLLVPWNFSLPQAPLQLEAPADRVLYVLPPGPAPAPSAPAHGAEAGAPPAEDAPLRPQPAPHRAVTLGALLPLLWAAGAALLLVWYLVGYLRFRRYVRRWAVPLSDPGARHMLEELRLELGVSAGVELLRCPGVSGPMLTGILRPAILLPDRACGREELWFALRHELCHCRRRDIAYKALLLLAKAVHWFNPLVWLMVRAAEGDMERACDDDVVRSLPPEAHSRYGQVILNAVRQSKKGESTHVS